MNEYDIYERAIERWGEGTQALMAIGEMNELGAALVRTFIQGRDNLGEVIEEIADVEIMLEQLRYMFGDTPVDEAKSKKLERLKGILDGTIEHPHKV